MWSRAELKGQAKTFLRGNYWISLAVVFIMVLVGGYDQAGNPGGVSRNYHTIPKTDYDQRIQLDNGQQMIKGRDGVLVIDDNTKVIYQDDEMVVVKSIPGNFFKIIDKYNFINWKDRVYISIERFLYKNGLTFSLLLGMLVGIGMLINIFISNLVNYGGNRFFLQGAKGEVEISNLWDGFQKDRYLKIVGTMFLRDIFTFLWTLLLIIPGIIKAYSYSMVPFVLSDEPELSGNEAIKRSMELTDGHKWKMFVLDLSFIGWYLLGSLLLGLGRILVHPYNSATKAQLYMKLVDINNEKYMVYDAPTDYYESEDSI